MNLVSQGTGRRLTSAPGVITRTGRDWIAPAAPQTSWQREQEGGPLLPMENELTGRAKFWSWLACLAVGALFWTALFAWVL